MSIVSVIYVIIGGMLGLVMGAMPGLTVTMTTVLIVSLTFGWTMVDALALIMGAFVGGVTGGALSAISMNIPGTAAAVATVFDGNPLKNKGEAHNALGLALITSFIGGLFGTLFLFILGPIIGNFALRFGSQEYFLITVWGLTLVAVLSKGSVIQGLITACIGLFVGMIGMDPITGFMRFTFKSRLLSGGIHYVVALIGLFGMKEVFVQLNKTHGFSIGNVRYRLKDLLPKPALLKKVITTMIWSGPIGAIIGLLPGTGGDIGALVAYGFTKQLVKKPSRPFGQGAYEGIAGPETANNAAIGGAMTTMLTLGIPGDSVSAVILGSFYLHGLLPGPTFMISDHNYFSLVVSFLLIGAVAVYILGIVSSNMMLKMLRLPQWFLVPFITILCITGSFALQNNIFDVVFMIIFGVIGFIFEKSGYPVSPMVLGIILGPIMEINFRQALINTGSMPSLLLSFVTRPICIGVLVLLVGSFIIQARVMKRVAVPAGTSPSSEEKGKDE
jgi:putative tricarboxylic transport membrane protein